LNQSQLASGRPVEGRFRNQPSEPANEEEKMKIQTKPGKMAGLFAVGLGLIAAGTDARAQNAPEQLSAQWWQWALSIPTSVNPMLDGTGGNCMVGQRGKTWFLAGTFFGGNASRTCFVPEGVSLFLPIVNAVNINTPHVCGQKGDLSVQQLRDASDAFIRGVTTLTAELDRRPLTNVLRVESVVFPVTLPEDNVFDAPCQSIGNVPAGVFSPGVDTGYYLMLDPLPVGSHRLTFHAENPSQNFSAKVTYDLRVVRVSSK
jgi:hypothetical protein